MVKVLRRFGGLQWWGEFPIDWEDPPPPEDPGWGYGLENCIGLIHPWDRWGEPLRFDEHELVDRFDCGWISMDCFMAISLRETEHTQDEVDAWAEAAKLRMAAYPSRILSTCPGCNSGGHRYCPW